MERAFEHTIRELVERAVEAEGMELIYVECLRMKSRWLVRLYLDRDGGVTIDDCADVSNQVGDILDVHDIPPGPYTLEVSSPGLDRPLDREKDFLRFRGSQVHIKLADKMEGRRNFQGTLLDLASEGDRTVVLLEMSGAVHHIPKDRIVKAHLVSDPG